MDILKVYPSGRVTASRRKKFNLEAVSRPYSLTEQQDWDVKQVQIHGFDIALEAKNTLVPVAPLGLSSVSNLTAESETALKPPKKQRGRNGITSRSRQLVKDAATLLQDKHGKAQLAFITFTIPPQFVAEIHANWQSILHNLRRRYIRALQKAGLSEEIVMVTEYQEERLAKYGKAVLHLHIVFQGRHKKRHWSYSKEQHEQHWRECCENYIENATSDEDWNASARCESIRKSCANYLGKYMSKGVATLGSIVKLDPDAYIPPSWHVCTQVLRCDVRRKTRHFEGKTATELFEWISSNAVELLKFNRYIKIPTTDGRRLVVGWYGDLKHRDLFNCMSVV